MTKELLLLNQDLADLNWLIKLRKARKNVKLQMISEKCPCCVRRTISLFYCYSDENLITIQKGIIDELNSLISNVDISEIL